MAVKSLQDLRATQKEAATTRRSQALWQHIKGDPALKGKRVILLVFAALTVLSLINAEPGAVMLFGVIAGWAWWRLNAAANAAVPREKPAATPLLQTTAARRAQRLTEALAQSERGLTVEQISADLRWALHAVIEGLQAGIEAGDIAEDFDTRSGHFVYLNVARTLAGGALDPDHDALAQGELRRFDDALRADASAEEAREVAARRPASAQRASRAR
jgi:hypothetical protein